MKDYQIIILNMVSRHLLSCFYYNWFGDFKQNNYISAKLWNTFYLLMNFSTFIIPEENCWYNPESTCRKKLTKFSSN
jgi:hypothetical protein